jgi:spore germination protein GerM
MRYAERWKYLGISILVIVFLPLWSGCWPGKGTGANDPSFQSQKKSAETAMPGQIPDDNGLTRPGEQLMIVLFFSNNEGYLAAEKRSVPKMEGIGRVAVQELIKGPAPGNNLYPTIPQGTILRDIDIKNGLATVDFSKELKLNHRGGSTGELLTVYSIVNTLTQFPAVQQVQILIEGKKEETLAGHMDLTQPLARDDKIIRTVSESKS